MRASGSGLGEEGEGEARWEHLWKGTRVRGGVGSGLTTPVEGDESVEQVARHVDVLAQGQGQVRVRVRVRVGSGSELRAASTYSPLGDVARALVRLEEARRRHLVRVVG